MVTWSPAANGCYLIRNRATGETFQVGHEEEFLLGQLDGRRTGEQLRAAFAARFGQPLSAEELAEFIALAVERGLLNSGSDAAHEYGSVVRASAHAAIPTTQRSIPPTRQFLGRLLGMTELPLQWLVRHLNAAQRRIRYFGLKHFAFVPRADDIFIVTYPRSGTTWLQMMLYQLTTDGSMEIPHIAEYCPWFERSFRSARGFEIRPPPRIFKSHLSFRRIPKGPCKYIYVARDGRDVAVSYYNLYRMYKSYEGSFAEFFDWFIQGKVDYGSWFDHVRAWAQHRNDANVLFLTYEELTRDLERCVRKIIAFCDFEVPEEKLPRILERCSFAFMKKHETKFDPALETLWEEGVRLNAFLRNGKSGEGALQLSNGQKEQFDKAFQRHFKNGVIDWSADQSQRQRVPLYQFKTP